MAKTPQPVQTIVIDNFSGALTRKTYGKMNSGLAQYSLSYGYNPFVFPGSLTWLPDFTDVSLTGGCALDGKTRVESGVLYLYLITDSGNLEKVNTSDNTHSLLNASWTGSPTWNYGGALEVFNGKIWITNDKGLTSINFDGTGETQVGTWDSSHFIQNTYHPLKNFAGRLYIGNTTDGTSTNIGEIDSTNTITNYSRLSPSLSPGSYIKDMDVTPDFSYLVMSVSAIPPENISGFGGQSVNLFAGDSTQVRWNGTDTGITAGTSTPNFNITALNFFGESSISFMYDWFGASVYDGAKKLLSLMLSKSPLPNASASTGNMIFWAAPAKLATLGGNASRGSYGVNAYGAFDEDQAAAMYRLMFRIPTESQFLQVTQMPFMTFVNNAMFQPQAATNATSVNKLYASVKLIDGLSNVTNRFHAWTINANPGLAGGASQFYNATVTPAANAQYTTQIQTFEKKVSVSAIRVYTDDTNSGNSFTISLLGGIGSASTNPSFGITNGTFTWTKGTSPEPIGNRINFNPSIAPTYSLGLQIINAGSTNMVFRRIELDVTPAGE